MQSQPSFAVALCRKAITLDWVLLALILPLVVFPEPSSTLALLLIPALWLIRRVAYGHFIPATPVDWPLFGLLLMVLVSLLVTADVTFSLPKIAGMVFGIGVFYSDAASVGGSWHRLWLGVGVLLSCGWGVVVVGIAANRWPAQLPFLSALATKLPRFLVTLPGIEQALNANEIAGALLWMPPLALVLSYVGLREEHTLRGRLPAWQMVPALAFVVVSTLIFGAFLLLTQSRGAFLGFAVAILFVLVAANRRSRWLILLVGLVLLGGAAVIIIGTEDAFSLFSDLVGTESGIDVLDTLEGRREIWSRALYGIQDFPLTGMGMNMFRRAVHILYPLFLISPGQDIAHAHNHLLQTALDLGIPGLVAYLSLWLGMGWMLLQIWRTAEDVWIRALALGFSSSLVAYFIYGVTDAIALGARPGFIFWLLLGLVTGLHRLVVA
jgi:putative inorganic carbon (HCO3(-)) transporter